MYPTKAEIKAANTQAIIDAGLTFISSNNGECLSFRDPLKMKADFYPSTGRWCYKLDPHAKRPVTREGGAQMFIRWYVEGKL